MMKNKTADTKMLHRRFNWFWLITYGAVMSLLIPDRSPFMTALILIVVICGTVPCVLEQQWELEERARRRDDEVIASLGAVGGEILAVEGIRTSCFT